MSGRNSVAEQCTETMGNQFRRVMEECSIGELPEYMKEYAKNARLNHLPFSLFSNEEYSSQTYVVYSGTSLSSSQSVRENERSLPQRDQSMKGKERRQRDRDSAFERVANDCMDEVSEKELLLNLVDLLATSSEKMKQSREKHADVKGTSQYEKPAKPSEEHQ